MDEDLAVLNTADDAPADVSSVQSETASPESPTSSDSAPPDSGTTTSSDTAQTSGAEASQPDDDAEMVAYFQRTHPEAVPALKQLKAQLDEFHQAFGSVRDARMAKETLQAVGGVEGLKQIKARTESLEKVDQIIFGHDEDAKRAYLGNLMQQGPENFKAAVWNGINILRQNDPDAYSYVIGPLMADSLNGDFTWQILERAYELSDNPEIRHGLNVLAGKLGKYGIGPGEPEPTGQMHVAFRGEVANALSEDLDRKILLAMQDQLGPERASDPQLLTTIFQQAQAALFQAAKSNKSLQHAYRSIMRNGISRQTGERAVRLITSKLSRIIPGTVKKLAAEFTAPKEEVAPKPQRIERSEPQRFLTQGEANRMAMKEILDSPFAAAAKASAASVGGKLTKEQARSMTFRQVIDDEREVETT